MRKYSYSVQRRFSLSRCTFWDPESRESVRESASCRVQEAERRCNCKQSKDQEQAESGRVLCLLCVLLEKQKGGGAHNINYHIRSVVRTRTPELGAHSLAPCGRRVLHAAQCYLAGEFVESCERCTRPCVTTLAHTREGVQPIVLNPDSVPQTEQRGEGYPPQ